jgi:glutamine cyclotransferase
MSKFDVSQLDITNAGNRAKAEADAQNGLAYDGRRRLKVGKDKPDALEAKLKSGK